MGFTLVGFGFSAYLTYRELFTIHAVCEWCASSAVIMTILTGLATWRFLRGEPPAHDTGPPVPQGAGAESAARLGSAS
jgi:uncharacterized membrane protein